MVVNPGIILVVVMMNFSCNVEFTKLFPNEWKPQNDTVLPSDSGDKRALIIRLKKRCIYTLKHDDVLLFF